ncbi:MAG TPA: hypothetical protein VGN16_03725 [Acidobacteriaceae bacterium]|jgi:hypothetical protein
MAVLLTLRFRKDFRRPFSLRENGFGISSLSLDEQKLRTAPLALFCSATNSNGHILSPDAKSISH